MGGEQSDTAVDVEVVSTGAGDGGVAHGEAILAFVDAAMAVDPSRTTDARERLAKAIGDSGVVDVAAVTAMFQLNTRAADSAGIAVEGPTVEHRSNLGARLGFAPRTEGIAP